MTNPKTTTLELAGVNYKLHLDKLTVGQLIDCEVLKLKLSDGGYSSLVQTRTKTSDFVLDLIDAVSTFSVFIPDLKKDLNYKSYLEVPGQMAKELVQAYKQVLPDLEGYYNELITEKPSIKEKTSESDDIV